MKLELNVVRFEANDIMTASGDVVEVSYNNLHYHISSETELPTSITLNNVDYRVRDCLTGDQGKAIAYTNGATVPWTRNLAGTYVYTNGVWEKQ